MSVKINVLHRAWPQLAQFLHSRVWDYESEIVACFATWLTLGVTRPCEACISASDIEHQHVSPPNTTLHHQWGVATSENEETIKRQSDEAFIVPDVDMNLASSSD